MSLTENKPVKQLDEYKIAMKNLLIEKNKSLDYVSGYVTCLMDNNHIRLQEAIDLLKYTSNVYFKKMGWK